MTNRIGIFASAIASRQRVVQLVSRLQPVPTHVLVPGLFAQ